MPLNNTFILDVDIKETNYAYERKVTANDSITFVINLTNEGLPLDLSSVTTVSLANTRLDKVTVVTPGTKTGTNQVTFNLGQNETKTPGRVGAVVQLYDASGRVSMLGFNYTVVEDPTGNTYVPPGDDLTLIQVILGDGPLVIQQAKQAKTDADKATADARTAIQSITNTTAAVNAEVDNAIADMNTTVNNNITSINNDMKITHKGTVATYSLLPTSGQQVGDTWVVTSDGTPANNGVWRWQSNSTWLKINNLNISGAETVSNVGVVAKATAEIARQSVHSGVLDYTSNIVTVSSSAEKGGLYINTDKTLTNTLGITNGKAIINGNTIEIKGFNALNNVNKIQLPDPPTFGTRDDLAFLEAWFPQTGNGYELSWRIRTVVGVDFTINPEGFKANGGQWKVTPVTPQGGNIEPIVFDYSVNGSALLRSQVHKVNPTDDANFTNNSDAGLYIAGTGDQTSKDLLKTYDGYSYFLPLFRVKRRNSGGYRADNLNGARDYYGFTTSSSMSTVSLNYGSTMQITVDSTSTMKVGDTIVRSTWSLGVAKIVSIDSSTQATIMGMSPDRSAYNVGASTSFTLVSDRPDGLYSNIIDASDIIDLRHKVSLTGFNYQQLLEENFDKLLRGELTTKDTKTTAKETFNLRKAPLGLKQELQSVKVKGNDGVERELVNLLGDAGNCEDTSKLSVHVASASISLDSSNAKYGKNAIKYTVGVNGSGGGVKKDFLVTSGKYYLAMADVKNGNIQTGVQLQFGGVNGSNNATSEYKVSYAKYYATSNNTTTLYVFSPSSGTISGQYAYVDGIRLYEISQSEYDKIDVDSAFTGEELAKKFPYVDSYPNFVENLAPTNADGWEQGSLSTTDGSLVSSNYEVRLKNHLPVTPSTTYTVSIHPSYQVYVMEFDSSNVLGTKHAYIAKGRTFTVASTATKIKLIVKLDGTTAITPNDINKINPQLEIGSVTNIFVPFGRYYLPYDYASGATKHYITESFNGHRQVFSDAQTSQTFTDKIEVLRTPQKHIKVTQATEGTWAVNDTIKVKSDYGVVSAVGSAFVKATQDVTNTTVIYVDDVSKLAVNDTIRYWNIQTGLTGGSDLTITAIDTTNKTITVNIAQNPKVGDYFTKTNVNPVVTATGIVGSWTNLGTKEATYTITTAPTDNKTDILIQYAVNYPSGKGIVNVPSDVLEGEVNGQRLVKTTGNVVLKDNFSGKVSGNTDACPHISKHNQAGNQTTLLAPSAIPFEVGASTSSLYSLDNNTVSLSTSVNGAIPQTLFSFNLIEIVERKFGEGFFADCVTVVDKVAKLKSGLAKITCNWWGYGSSVGGNKATLAVYDTAWGSFMNHTNSTVTKLTHATNNMARIQNDGFIHYLAYADPSDGTTASTIYTDYVDIELEINPQETGYTVLAPSDQMPVLSENLLTSNAAFPVDVSGFTVVNGATLSISSLGWLYVSASGVDIGTYISAGSFNKDEYFTASFEVKGTGTIKAELYREANARIGFKDSISLISTPQVITVIGKLDTSGEVRLYIRASGVAGATFELSKIKIQKGSVSNPTFSAGRNKKKILNYLGKVAGSSVENPHKTINRWTNTFESPDTIKISGTEYNQTNYNNIGKQDGNLVSQATLTNGFHFQQLFEFDLSHLGMSLTELKKALRKLTVSWTGYGSGSNAGVQTYGVNMKAWSNTTNTWGSWGSNATTTPSTLTYSATTDATITKDQKVYILVHSTYPSDGTIASEIYTDYIKLEVELADYVDLVKSNIVLVRPETKEVKLKYPAKSYKLMGYGSGLDQVGVHYRYVPIQSFKTSSASLTGGKILTKPKAYVTTLSTTNGKIDYTYFLGLSKDNINLALFDEFTVIDNMLNSKLMNLDFISSEYADTSSHPSMYEVVVPLGEVVGTYRTDRFAQFGKITSITDSGMWLDGRLTYWVFRDLKKTLNKATISPVLVVNSSGELYMLLFSSFVGNSQNNFIESVNKRIVAYKIDGKPIIKS